MGRTTVVGIEPTRTQSHLLEVVTTACENLISHIKPGVKVNELCKICDQFLLDHGVSLSSLQTDQQVTYVAYPPLWCHGLGMTWEQPYFTTDVEEVIQPGMYIAIEKALYRQDIGTVFYEQNVLVTEKGVNLLPDTKKRWHITD